MRVYASATRRGPMLSKLKKVSAETWIAILGVSLGIPLVILTGVLLGECEERLEHNDRVIAAKSFYFEQGYDTAGVECKRVGDGKWQCTHPVGPPVECYSSTCRLKDNAVPQQ